MEKDCRKNNNILRIPTSLSGNFFRLWIEFLSPFHHLTPRETEVAASFLNTRFTLSKSISDDTILNTVLMSKESKSKIMKECNMTSAHFQAILSKLREVKFIVDGVVNPKFIPKELNQDDKSFRLLIYFDFNEESNRQSI